MTHRMDQSFEVHRDNRDSRCMSVCANLNPAHMGTEQLSFLRQVPIVCSPHTELQSRRVRCVMPQG
jgi:hypothetical protein